MGQVDIKKLLQGERRALAKAITLIESSNPKHQNGAKKLLADLQNKTFKTSLRIGISGSPGVGKSTFIESFGEHLLSLNYKIAVLTIDPSSPLSGGSILGDKTRMEKLTQNENVFIRPSPSSGTLGGVANKTKETIFLCEASGHDIILVETVGVGQSEFDVANIVDFFLLLILPSGGDELQGIKKGILELANLIIINKEDLNKSLAQTTQRDYQNAVHLLSSKDEPLLPVLTCSALNKKGLNTIWSLISSDFDKNLKSGKLFSNRVEQEIKSVHKLIFDGIKNKFNSDERAQKVYQECLQNIRNKKISAFDSSEKILNTFFSKSLNKEKK